MKRAVCWSGCVVLLIVTGSPRLVGHAYGAPFTSGLRNRHVLPPKYRPITWKDDGPFCGAEVLSFIHTSSRPNRTRVGTPPESRAGSGWTQLLYQDCTPGPYAETPCAVPASADPVLGLLAWLASYISVQ